MTVTPDDGFTAVSHKKPARAPKNRKGKHKLIERTLEDKLAQGKDRLASSRYIQACRDMVREALHRPPGDASSSECPEPKRVVCLGLGSITESTKAQDQYVLLVELVEELRTLVKLDENEPVQFYDPVFSPEDAAFLSAQGHRVLSSDFPLALSHPTFLYIPHGPRTLFNALLEANWTNRRLPNVVIFGNRLDLYDDPTYSGTTSQSGEGRNQGRDPDRLERGPDEATEPLMATTARRKKKNRKGRGHVEASLATGRTDGELSGGVEWIRKAAPLFEIVPLPPTKDHLEAFNDLALEWVDPDRLDRAVREGRLPMDGPALLEGAGETVKDERDEGKEEARRVQGEESDEKT
ncbi:hypothetical protein JCM10212_001435 [Sporobolomyces blumeae]